MISYIRTPMGRQNLSGSDFESAKREMLNFLELDVALVTSVHRTSWAGVHGTKYIPNECILLVKSENETPVFGTLRVIWLVNLQVVVFRVSVLETVNFNVHLNAYRVQEPAQATGLDLVLKLCIFSTMMVINIYLQKSSWVIFLSDTFETAFR